MAVEMPEGMGPLIKNAANVKKDLTDVEKQVDEFTDSLMQSDWQSFNTRPRRDVVGYYAVCEWFPIHKNWAVLYVDKGPISKNLDLHFRTKARRGALSHYLSTFSHKNLFWIKWIKDPFHPYEGFSMEDVLASIKDKYNCGEMPTFNSELVIKEDTRDDFSILGASWYKNKNKKK